MGVAQTKRGIGKVKSKKAKGKMEPFLFALLLFTFALFTVRDGVGRAVLCAAFSASAFSLCGGASFYQNSKRLLQVLDLAVWVWAPALSIYAQCLRFGHGPSL
jgi:hypothetical protein